MIDSKSINRQLGKFIEKGIDKFIIYPFGSNGVNVKNILSDYYNIEPILIVDNEYMKFNPHIVSFRMLKEGYDPAAYIILTIEDEIVNRNMMSELQAFVPVTQIINLLDLKKKEADLYHFHLDSFLPSLRYDRETISRAVHKRLKVRFVNPSGSTWNSIKTICQAFQSDNNYDVLLITGEYVADNVLEEIEKDGFRCVKWNQYKVEDDFPDVLVLNHPYDRMTQIKDCRKYCKLIIVASMQLIRYAYSMEAFWEIQREAFERFRPDYYLFDSLLYNEIIRSKYDSEKKIIEMGNAKFDGIFNACREKKYEDSWKKLENKKTVLWTTDHGVCGKYVSREVTFDLYARAIFEYADKNPEIGLIFRPHSTFISEMLKNHLWSEEDLEILKKYCQRSSNLVFDDNVTYDNAYSVADGIITDAFCGITCSALPTLKPICLTYRHKDDLPYHQDLADCYYAAYSKEDIISFFELIKNEKDHMLEKRKKALKEYIKHFDGKNGERIKAFIVEKLQEIEKVKSNKENYEK